MNIKIIILEKTKYANSYLLEIFKEDHTLANVLMDSLIKDENILYAGYSMGHASEMKINMVIHLNPEKKLKDVLNQHADGILQILNNIK